jgi:hypothetical protein
VSAHTPGPWTLKSARANDAMGSPVEAEIRGGLNIVVRLGALHTERQKADARLIVMAPALAAEGAKLIDWIRNNAAPEDADNVTRRMRALLTAAGIE